MLRQSLLGMSMVVALWVPLLLAAQTPGDIDVGARNTFTIAGSVHDAKGDALYGAEIRAGNLYTTSDAEGSFTLRGVPLDTVTVRVRRIGFNAAQLHIMPPEPGQRVQLAVQLTMNAVALGTIVVEGKALDTKLWDIGFYHRQKLGRGRFITPDFWAHFGGAGIGTVLRETPQVIVERKNNQDYAYSRAGNHLCRMNVFVDGSLAQWAGPGVGKLDVLRDPGQALDQIVPREDIYAIEIYGSPASVPQQFIRAVPAEPRTLSVSRVPSRQGSVAPPLDPIKVDCGALVIWTRWYAARRGGA
jgi:hypothetical protein